MVLMGLGAFSLPAMFVTGNLILGIVGVLLIGGGFLARKPESYDEYRNRYEERFGIAEDTPEDGEENEQR